MKKKLLVLLGAGSSVAQGRPKTEKLDCLMGKWASAQASAAERPDYFKFFWKNRASYLYLRDHSEEENWLAWAMVRPNYERCLGDLQVLMNAAIEKPWGGDPLLHWLRCADMFEGYNINPSTAGFQAVFDQLADLVGRLACHFRKECCRFEENRDKTESFVLYRNLFDGLRERFDIGVYSLNHDTVVLNALPDFFTGFDGNTGGFQPADVHSRPEWSFLYHLHGSAHFNLTKGVEKHVEIAKPLIEWKRDINDSKGFTDVSTSSLDGLQLGNDGRKVVLTTLVAGGWKLDQIQAEPFQTFYSTLPRHAYEADAILIGGYGFGDEHVNSVLSNMLRERKNDRPPVLVLGHNEKRDQKKDGEPPVERMLCNRRDDWTYNLKETLQVTDLSRFGATDNPTKRPCGPPRMPLKMEQFEVSSDAASSCPVAVWFGGFDEANARIDQIEEWLKPPDKAAQPTG